MAFFDPMQYGVDQLQQLPAPIGTTALEQRPPFYKAMDVVTHGGIPFMALHTRARARTITGGEARHGIGRNWYKRSLAISRGNVEGKNGFHAILEDQKREIVSKFLPTTWWKYPTVDVFNPINKNLEAVAGGWIGRGVSRIPGLGPLLKNSGAINEEGGLTRVWDPHFFSRMSASYTWDKSARLQGRRFFKANRPVRSTLSGSERGNLDSYLRQANPALAERVGELGEVGYKDAAGLVRMSGIRPWSGRLGGYMEGVRNGGMDAYGDILKETSPYAWRGYMAGREGAALKSLYREQGVEGLQKLAGGTLESAAERGLASQAGKSMISVLGKTALAETADLAASVGELGLNPVMDALAVYGAVKLLGTVAVATGSAAVKEGARAYHSFKGDIGKPRMGMGYVDTLAASTSRQRGVMAIQNSRLNARSILGSEAGAVAAHFGY